MEMKEITPERRERMVAAVRGMANIWKHATEETLTQVMRNHFGSLAEAHTAAADALEQQPRLEAEIAELRKRRDALLESNNRYEEEARAARRELSEAKRKAAALDKASDAKYHIVFTGEGWSFFGAPIHAILLEAIEAMDEDRKRLFGAETEDEADHV